MDFQEFCNIVVSEAARLLPDTTTPAIRMVLKNNDIEQSALYVKRSDIACSPMVYLEPYYQNYLEGQDLNTLMQDILRCFETPFHPPALYRFAHELTDPAPYLYVRLIHLEHNTRQLADVPYEKYLDLAAVCELAVEGPELDGTALIHNRHLTAWDMTKEELFSTAWKNTFQKRPPCLKPIEEPLFLYERAILHSGISPCNSSQIPSSLRDTYLRWVSMMNNQTCRLFELSNIQNFHGAACLLYPGILAQIADAMESDLYLIPSSIHEFLITPAENQLQTEDALTEILCEVNEEAVLPTEILCSHIYYYSRADRKLQSSTNLTVAETIEIR